MAKPRLVGPNAYFECNRYDLRKVMENSEVLLEALRKGFSVERAEFVRESEDAVPVRWPNPGAAEAHSAFGSMAAQRDVDNDPLIYLFDDITVKSFPLGKAHCIYHPASGEILTTFDEPASEIDNRPVVVVYGERYPDGQCGVLTAAQVDVVEEAVKAIGLGLVFERVDCDRTGRLTKHDKTQFAYITFPHEVYGDGRAEQVVRCVMEDGSEIGPEANKNLN